MSDPRRRVRRLLKYYMKQLQSKSNAYRTHVHTLSLECGTNANGGGLFLMRPLDSRASL